MALNARHELGAGDVDAVEGPPRWDEGQVRPVADPDFERASVVLAGRQDVAEDLAAGLADTALEDQEALLPRPEPPPARSVVKGRDNAISARERERADRLEDPVPKRRGAPAPGTARLPSEPCAAGGTARQVPDRWWGLGRRGGR